MDKNMMTKVFCDVDDFCKNFYQCLTQQMVVWFRKSSNIFSVYQWNHDNHHSGFRCFKHFYQMLLEIKV